MERGEAAREQVTVGDAIRQLIENTDDAYGFPPFATFAPHIRIGGDDYEALRVKEQALLREALQTVAVVRIRVPGHEWAELLPGLIERFENGHSDPEPILTPIPIVTEPEAIRAGDRSTVRPD